MVARTMQEMFDTVYTAFIHLDLPFSRIKSHDGKTRCRYHGANGTGCAIGIFLPRELAKQSDMLLPGMMSMSISSVMARDPEVKAHLVISDGDPREHIPFLTQLQYAHDGASRKEVMKDSLEKLAIFYGLTIPENPVDLSSLEMCFAPKTEVDHTTEINHAEDLVQADTV